MSDGFFLPPEPTAGQLSLLPCEAWCWTTSHKKRGNAPVRPCTRRGAYDPVHDAVLCTQHESSGDPCLSESDAQERRRLRNLEIRDKHRRLHGRRDRSVAA